MGSPQLKVVPDNIIPISTTIDIDHEPVTTIEEITVPIEVETLRLKYYKTRGKAILLAFAKRITGSNNVSINEVYYNRDYRLELECEVTR